MISSFRNMALGFLSSKHCLKSFLLNSLKWSSLLSKHIAMKSDNVKSFKDIPGPVRLPLLGNLYQYKFGMYNVLKYHTVLEELHKLYGPLVKQTLGTRTMINVFDPEDIKTVYKHEGFSPQIAPLLETAQMYREQQHMSPGLGNVNGDEWYRLRSAVRRMMLRPKEVHYYLPFIQEVAIHFVQQIEMKCNSEGEIDNLRDEVSKWSQESAGMVCFETRMGCMSGGETENLSQLMIEANKTIFYFSGLLKFSLPIYKYIQTPKWKRVIEAENFFYRNALKYVDQTIQKIEECIHNNEILGERYNFMAYLLSKKELSRKDVTIITFSLFADGLSTTVPALLYNLYCLATNHDIQEKAYQEITTAWSNDVITVKMLNNLPYLKAVVKETFRLYPIGTEVTRIIPKDLLLSGYLVPAGTQVDLCPNVHFRSGKYFSNPNQFLPERWLRDGEANIHPYLLTPFGHGTRTCAGRRFAEQDLYVVLCCILKKFKLQCQNSAPLEQVYNTLLFPDGAVKVQFIPRK